MECVESLKVTHHILQTNLKKGKISVKVALPKSQVVSQYSEVSPYISQTDGFTTPTHNSHNVNMVADKRQ